MHAEYLRAGADVIETNTFGANRIKLRAFGLSEKVATINSKARGSRAPAARHSGSGRRGAFVAGAIGPLGIRVEPWGKTGIDEAEQYFTEQAEALVEGGVDLFILETFRDLNEIGAAIAAVRACVRPADRRADDDRGGWQQPRRHAAGAVRAGALERGAQVVGVNCSVGPRRCSSRSSGCRGGDACALSALPNAGKPRDIEGRNIYLCSPEYMASYARRFIANGVRLVGGCCGTTPEHIRQISAAVKRMAPAAACGAAGKSRYARRVGGGRPARADAGAASAKSRLAAAAEQRRFVDRRRARAAARAGVRRGDRDAKAARRPTRRRGDRPRWPAQRRAHERAVAGGAGPAAGRMSRRCCSTRVATRTCWASSRTCSGAYAMGLRNLLGITGDVRTLGDIPDATAVFDVDSIGLTNVLTRLNHGLDIGGQPIGAPTAFHVGVMVNPAADDLDAELRRFEYKVEAGAEFAVTRPVFDVAAMERFLDRTRDFRIPIIAGLWPFESALNAEFMANEVPGVTVPGSAVATHDAGRERRGCGRRACALPRSSAAALRPMVQGLHVSAPSGRLDLALQTLEGA